MTKNSLLGVASVLVATIALFSLNLSAAVADQPKLGSRQIPVITLDGLKFRDLNRNNQLDPYEDWRLSPADRTADLVSRMSLAEKAGTMMHGWLPAAGDRYDLNRAQRTILESHITSGITWLTAGPARFARQNNALQEVAEQTRLGIPVTVSTDPRNLFRQETESDAQTAALSVWPKAAGFGAIGDPDAVRLFADISRREYRAVGIHMGLSPMADLASEPRWGRISGTFGEEPEQVRELVQAYAEGLQGSPDGLAANGVISVVKHWAGHGAAAEKGFDGHLAYGRWSAFPGAAFEQHLVPYEGAFAAKVSGVMPSYTILRDLVHDGHRMEPVGGAFNQYLLTDLLRGRYGFNGLILSDWGVMENCPDDCMNGTNGGLVGMPWGMEKATKLERYVKAVQAGIDQLGGAEQPEYLIEAVERGLLSEERLAVSARRVLLLKFQLGLFENPYVSPQEAETVVSNPASHAAALNAQHRSLVLLKNENSLLPLRKKFSQKKPIRVYLKGVDAAVAEARGLIVVTDASEADLAIIRLQTPREYPYPNSKSFPEGNLAFAPGQPDFDAVVSLAANGLPVVASVHLERPAILTALLPHVQGLFGDFGVTDSALLDVILGEAEPEGRLPFELPSSMAAVEAQKPDLPHDSANPLFPIHFGLRYAK